jgi:hypothetical protein
MHTQPVDQQIERDAGGRVTTALGSAVALGPLRSRAQPDDGLVLPVGRWGHDDLCIHESGAEARHHVECGERPAQVVTDGDSGMARVRA